MQLTLQLRLLPSAEQAASLTDTMQRFNAAANAVAEVAFREKIASKFKLHKLVYYDIRREFDIPADMAIRIIAQVCEAYKRDLKIKPIFRPTATIPYSYGKNYTFKKLDRVSIQICPIGRVIVPFVMGEYQRKQFHLARGQADLIFRNGKWFFVIAIDVPEADAKEVSEFLGVDLGLVNIATDSTGESFSGDQIEKARKRDTTARRTFQRKGTKNAKRRLKKMSGRRHRFLRHVNHVISKCIVAKATALGRGIAIEELKGIRKTIEKTVRKKQRQRTSNWAFRQLRLFLTYKAKLAGVPIVAVDPRNTSKTCFVCGHCDKTNRPSQDHFSCQKCGHTDNADHNAACNIAARAICKLAS